MRRSHFIIVSLAAVFLPPTPSRGTDLGNAVRSHMVFLADDLLRGRDAGSAEYEIAARYVEANFQRLGLAPAGEAGTYRQAVPLLRNQLDSESATLEIVAPKGRRSSSRRLTWLEDFVMRGDPVRAETKVTAPVVFVGWGIHAPELGHNDFQGISVEGKILLVLRGAPGSFPHNQRAYYSSNRTKRLEAVKRGAVGVVIFLTSADAQRVPWERLTRNAARSRMRWVRRDGTAQDFSAQLEGLALLSHSGADKLLAGSEQSLQEILDAAADGRAQPFELPIQVALARRTTHQRVSSPNVAALLPGADPDLQNEFVVYTAHLDHVGIGKPRGGDEIYNGAYDNAAGVGALLETARLFSELAKRPRRSILFLAVTAEEKGLLGSDYFAHNPTVPIDKIVANVNLDMPLLMFPLANVTAYGAEHSSLDGTVRRAAEAAELAVSPDPMPEEVLFIRSDQYSFVRQGIPSVFLVPGRQSRDPDVDGKRFVQDFLKNHYHMPSDDLSLGFDADSAARFTRVNFFIGQEVANAEQRPTWNEGDFFGEKFAQPGASRTEP